MAMRSPPRSMPACWSATSLLSALMWWYASRDPHLMSADVTQAARQEGLITPLLMGGVFVLSIVIAQMWSATAAQWSWLLLIPCRALGSQN